MKPIYVMVSERTGEVSRGGGSRAVKAYLSEGRARVQQTMGETIVPFGPITEIEEGQVVIDLHEYEYLRDRLNFLSALESMGVDNWSGYSEAYGEYYADYVKDHEEEDEEE